MNVTGNEIILFDPTLNTGGPYPIDFDRCDSAAKILDWVRQLCQKEWVTREQIAYFVSQATSHYKIDINIDA